VCPTEAVISHRTKRKDIERISKKHFFILPAKCKECKGISSVPLCMEICPMSCIIKRPCKKET
jgi:ferredoxin